MLPHYLRKADQAKYVLTKNKKNVNKFHLSRSVAPNRRSITSFDCYAAACLPDDVQECWWFREKTVEFLIGLEQNIIDTAVNGHIQNHLIKMTKKHIYVARTLHMLHNNVIPQSICQESINKRHEPVLYNSLQHILWTSWSFTQH